MEGEEDVVDGNVRPLRWYRTLAPAAGLVVVVVIGGGAAVKIGRDSASP
jgi:hypothetical protein